MKQKPNVETLQQGLLYDLAGKSGLMYLSDLKFPQFYACVLSALAVTAPFQFSVKEWNLAIVYILNEEGGFREAEAARDYLMEQMKKINRLSNEHQETNTANFPATKRFFLVWSPRSTSGTAKPCYIPSR